MSGCRAYQSRRGRGCQPPGAPPDPQGQADEPYGLGQRRQSLSFSNVYLSSLAESFGDGRLTDQKEIRKRSERSRESVSMLVLALSGAAGVLSLSHSPRTPVRRSRCNCGRCNCGRCACGRCDFGRCDCLTDAFNTKYSLTLPDLRISAITISTVFTCRLLLFFLSEYSMESDNVIDRDNQFRTPAGKFSRFARFDDAVVQEDREVCKKGRYTCADLLSVGGVLSGNVSNDDVWHPRLSLP